MKDFQGNELHVGDSVVYITGAASSPKLETGKVTKIYTGTYGKDECSVGSRSHIYSHRVMKM